jgi:hypothetical protein
MLIYPLSSAAGLVDISPDITVWHGVTQLISAAHPAPVDEPDAQTNVRHPDEFVTVALTPIPIGEKPPLEKVAPSHDDVLGPSCMSSVAPAPTFQIVKFKDIDVPESSGHIVIV